MKREVVDALIESLNDPNAGWRFNENQAFNDRIKCSIWLYGDIDYMSVSFRIPGKNDLDIPSPDLPFIAYLSPWRRKLFKAAKSHYLNYMKSAANDHNPNDADLINAIKNASREP